MIQRKQTLFLLQLVFFGIALLFVSVTTVVTNTPSPASTPVYLSPLHHPQLQSTTGHLAAIVINAVALILSFITIFLYKRRELQLKLCYVLAGLWIILIAMIAACPFVLKNDPEMEIHTNYFGCLIGAFAVLAALLAARFIKKDIELLKSADRIR